MILSKLFTIDVKKKQTILFAIAYLFLMFGYYISSTLSLLISIDHQVINLSFRIVSVISIITCLFFFSLFNYRYITFLFSIFWGTYCIRVFYDIVIRDIHFAGRNDWSVFFFLILNTIVPTLIISFLSKSFFKIKANWIFITILFISIFVFSILLLKADDLSMIFIFRNSLLNDNQELILNPITISTLGTIISLLAFVNLIFSSCNFYVNLFALILGIVLILLGASKGPLITFFIGLSYLTLLKYRFWRFMLIFSVFSLIFSVLFFFFSEFFQNLAIIDRFYSLSNNSDVGRQILFSDAIEQFVDNPIFGDQFVTKTAKFYPHNIILDVLMSTGFFGGIFFFPIIGLTTFKLFRLYKKTEVNVIVIYYAAIFLCYFLLNLTSGSIFLSPEFWISMAVFFVSNE